jgi:ribose 5-phosphate isomerase B
MRANRYPELRAAVCQNLASAQLAREHNDANVLCLGARVVTSLEAEGIVEKFFTTSFQGGRHSGRVHSLSAPLRAP